MIKRISYVATTSAPCDDCGQSVQRSLLLPAGTGLEDRTICPPCFLKRIEHGEFVILRDGDMTLTNILDRIDTSEVTCRNCGEIVTEAPECDECRLTCNSCSSLDADESRVCLSCYDSKETSSCRECGNTSDTDYCDNCHECDSTCPNCGNSHDECENCIRCDSCAEPIKEFEKEQFICPNCREQKSTAGIENTSSSSVVANGLGDEVEVVW